MLEHEPVRSHWFPLSLPIYRWTLNLQPCLLTGTEKRRAAPDTRRDWLTSACRSSCVTNRATCRRAVLIDHAAALPPDSSARPRRCPRSACRSPASWCRRRSPLPRRRRCRSSTWAFSRPPWASARGPMRSPARRPGGWAPRRMRCRCWRSPCHGRSSTWSPGGSRFLGGLLCLAGVAVSRTRGGRSSQTATAIPAAAMADGQQLAPDATRASPGTR